VGDVIGVFGYHDRGVRGRAQGDHVSLGKTLTGSPRLVQDAADKLGQPLLRRNDADPLPAMAAYQGCLGSPCPGQAPADFGQRNGSAA
jgi:hypothetical protein